MSFTNQKQDIVKMIQEAYKEEIKRMPLMKFGNEQLTYNKKKSNFLWTTHENQNFVIVSVHGFDIKDINLNLLKLTNDNWFKNQDNNELVKKFANYMKTLDNEPRKVLVNGHSLGCRVIGNAEIISQNKNTGGYLFSPYAINPVDEVSKFIKTTPRYQLIFYENDPVAQWIILSKDSYTNALVLKPTNLSLLFNSHSIDTFLQPLQNLETQIRSKFTLIDPLTLISKAQKEEQEQKEKEQPKSTTLSILQYNIKMFPKYIQNLRNHYRAKEIARRINQLSPDIVSLNELFDDEEVKTFQQMLSGYGHSHRVGEETNVFTGKFISGGAMLFSKYPIIEQDSTIYRHGSGEDAYANKGAVRIKIMKDGIPINIVSSHFQSGRTQKAFDTKETQWKNLNNKLLGDNSVPTIIVGDLNIGTNRGGDSIELFDRIKEKYGLTSESPTTSTTNDFKTSQGNILDHLLHKEPENYTITTSTRVLSGNEFKVEGGYKVREHGLIRAREVKNVKSAFKFLKNKDKKERYYDLADHYPVLFNVQINYK